MSTRDCTKTAVSSGPRSEDVGGSRSAVSVREDGLSASSKSAQFHLLGATDQQDFCSCCISVTNHVLCTSCGGDNCTLPPSEKVVGANAPTALPLPPPMIHNASHLGLN